MFSLYRLLRSFTLHPAEQAKRRTKQPHCRWNWNYYRIEVTETLTGLDGLAVTTSPRKMVEAAGIEPASANPLP